MNLIKSLIKSLTTFQSPCFVQSHLANTNFQHCVHCKEDAFHASFVRNKWVDERTDSQNIAGRLEKLGRSFFLRREFERKKAI